MNNPPSPLAGEQFKRHVAFKFRIGSILGGKPFLENEKLRFVEINGRHVARANIIANVIDKYIQEGEKKYASVTVDDASGQIKLKVFGDDIEKFSKLNQGDTILVIGMLRFWNNEVYITPEIIKNKDPAFLLVRKLELESEEPKLVDREKLFQLKDKIIQRVKDAEKDNGVEVESLIMELKEHPSVINQEIKKLLEDGLVYEPRPGKLRYLG